MWHNTQHRVRNLRLQLNALEQENSDLKGEVAKLRYSPHPQHVIYTQQVSISNHIAPSICTRVETKHVSQQHFHNEDHVGVMTSPSYLHHSLELLRRVLGKKKIGE